MKFYLLRKESMYGSELISSRAFLQQPSSSSSSSSSSQIPTSDLIQEIRRRKAYQEQYKDDQYLPAVIKNQGRYIGIIRDARKPQRPRTNVSFDEIMRRQGGFAVQRQAQARVLADQAGPALLTLVGKLAKDIKRVKALVNVESAANWITDRGLQEKGRKVKSEDLDRDINTPNNVIVTNPSGFYSIDGYRAVEPKQRFLLNQYYGAYPKKANRREHNYGTWYDESIRPLIPAAIGKQLFNKAVQIVLKSLGHVINKQADQQTRLRQQMTYLKCAPYIWKKKFIGYFAAMNANDQSKAAFRDTDYFKLYRTPDTRKKYNAINKLAINVFNQLYSGKPLSELGDLYDLIAAEVQWARTKRNELTFEVNFGQTTYSYEQAINILTHQQAMQRDMEELERPGERVKIDSKVLNEQEAALEIFGDQKVTKKGGSGSQTDETDDD